MRIFSDAQPRNPGSRDWPIVLTAAIGLFLSTLDTGVINIALPTLESKFHVSISAVSWTITLYLLLLSTTIVLFGRLSDRIGRVKLYVSGLAVFVVASILCGSSMNIAQLILSRGVQGIGAAMMQATATAIVTTAISTERRGSALGTLGMMLGLGPVLGPSVGGVLLSFVGWRWIFWINVPICIVGIWGCRHIPRSAYMVRHAMRLDVTGNALLGLSILGFLYGLSAPSATGLLPWWAAFFIGVASLVGYLVWESRVSDPIMDLSLFRTSRFAVPMFAVTVLGLATAVAFIVPPYFFEQVSKLPPWQVGLVNLAAPLGLVVLSRISGKRIDRYGTTRLMGFGLGTMLVPLIILCAMQINWRADLLFVLLLLYGMGAGIFVPSNLSAIMSAVSQELQGTIGAAQRMVQNIGIAIGTSLSASLMHTHSAIGATGFVAALREAWGVAAVLVLLSLLGVFSLSARRRFSET